LLIFKKNVDCIQKMLDNRAINLAERLSLLEYLSSLSKMNQKSFWLFLISFGSWNLFGIGI